MNVMKRTNKRMILWDVDLRDWSSPGIAQAVNYILRNFRLGSIIDLHDFAEGIGKNKDLVSILERVVPALQNRGYELITISELLGLK